MKDIPTLLGPDTVLPFSITCILVLMLPITFALSDPPTEHPVLNETCSRPELTDPPPSNSTSTIVAAVVGALVGLILIVLIILLVIYYQVCRKVDPAEENSRESAFDFSNKTAMTAVSVKGKNSKTSSEAEVEKGTAEENGNLDEVKAKTPPKDETTL